MNTPPVKIGDKPTRQPWIDAVKGGCIFLVILAHVNLTKAGDIKLANQLLSYFYYLQAAYMPCFFVISGYTFKDKPGILTQRARQLIQPYTYWSIIYFALFIILAYIHNRLFFFNSLKFLCGLFYSRPQLYPLYAPQAFTLMPPGSGPLWFLTALFISYLLFLPLYRAKAATRYLWIGGYLLLHQILHYCPILLPWSIDSAFSGALFCIF